ncbi:MAG: NADH-quinone oxidoreductase subunit NuoH [Burkholderiales bacterium]|nr:NADH-quinone oxidoreductase subunit NuoH [Burkholderiales bacterium]
MLESLLAFSEMKLGPVWGPAAYELVTSLVFIVLIVAPLMLSVAYLTLWERKLIGWMQIRIGPNRVGPAGLLQPIADGVKLLFKEVIFPANANRILYVLGPMAMILPAVAVWAVIPFAPNWVLADINAGLLYVMALTSLGVYGVIIAGWASNSKYAFLGAMRAAAQMVSYELAMGFALVVVLMVSGSLNLSDIVAAQGRGRFAQMGLTALSWNWLPLAPMLLVYFVSGIAETNRLPFDVVEGESEIVAGHMVEYSGMTFALFFLAEYMNMWLVSALTVVMFFGGWLPPWDSALTQAIPPVVWLLGKMFLVVSMFLWIRATLPRYRYDQIMRLGWKVFIPLTLVWIAVIGAWMQTPWSLWR